MLGEPKRWHVLVGFGKWASRVESRYFQPSILRGALLLVLVIFPFVWLASMVTSFYIGVFLLYVALGARALFEHGARVMYSLQRGDLDQAREDVGMMVSRNVEKMTPQEVSRAAIESVLENGNDAIFAAIFWFVMLGAPGVVMYRLVNTLDAMWGYKNARYKRFGRTAARLDDVLNYIPARLTALSYAVGGKFVIAIESWRNQAAACESPNAGPVMAAGAGALSLRLGGAAIYHGHWRQRPVLGRGAMPQPEDIGRAIALVQRGMLFWVLALAVFEGAWHFA